MVINYSRFFAAFCVLLILTACGNNEIELEAKSDLQLMILGNAQDAGYPQTGCTKNCCAHYYSGEIEEKYPTSLGLIDYSTEELFLFEATPAYREQWHTLKEFSGFHKNLPPKGIFLTHAHIGHYTGLAQLGHEVMGAQKVNVYAMPRMKKFLENNGPWSQLVHFQNIRIHEIENEKGFSTSANFGVTPIQVPHRDEYSETVGFIIKGANKTVLFIPDIDKWQKWNHEIEQVISKVDLALLDGTFYANGELPNRDMSQVPHPFIEESMELLKGLSPKEKAKIHFIHFNHTNPVIWDKNTQKELESKGFNWVQQGQVFNL